MYSCFSCTTPPPLKIQLASLAWPVSLSKPKPKPKPIRSDPFDIRADICGIYGNGRTHWKRKLRMIIENTFRAASKPETLGLSSRLGPTDSDSTDPVKTLSPKLPANLWLSSLVAGMEIWKRVFSWARFVGGINVKPSSVNHFKLARTETLINDFCTHWFYNFHSVVET